MVDKLSPRQITELTRAINRQLNTAEQAKDKVAIGVYNRMLAELEYQQTFEYGRKIALFKRLPPDWEEFLYSDEFLNGEINVWQTWIDVFHEHKCHPMLGKQTPTLANDSAIGTGKSVCAQLFLLYDITFLSCTDYPQLLFDNLSPKTDIYYTLQTVNFSTTKSVLYAPIRAYFSGMKWTKRNVEYNKKQLSRLVLSNGVVLAPMPANTECLLGLANLGAVVDELAFMEQVMSSKKKFDGGSYDQGAELIQTLINRRTSRFPETNLILPSTIYVSSSVNHSTDSMQQFKNGPVKKTVIRIKKWDVVPEFFLDPAYASWNTFTNEKEAVEVGKEKFAGRLFKAHLVPSDINNIHSKKVWRLIEYFLFDITTNKEVPLESGRESENINIFEVPVILRKNFTDDPVRAARDYLNVSPRSVFSYIQNKDVVSRALVPKKKGIIEHDIPSHEDFQINIDAFMADIKPDTQYFLHLDLSRTADRTGIGIAHLTGEVKQITGSDIISNASTIKLPKIVVDYALTVTPNKAREMDYTFITRFIDAILATGMPIYCVTADQSQSHQFLVDLRKKDVIAFVRSVDKNDKCYEVLKDLLLHDCVELPDSEILKLELENLQVRAINGVNKVDHPLGGICASKDAADGVCGAVYSAYMYAYNMKKLY
jgi:hypothetical protein